MNMKRTMLLAASVLALISTTGCKREAAGQVVAVVNGDEITRQEVEAELGGRPLPQGLDAKQAQQLILQRVVDRHLLAGAAKADGIDKDQEYLLKQRQMSDTLLAQMLGERAGRTFQIPDNAAIDKFIAAHPTIFAQRTLFQLDQVLFAPPSDANQVRALKDDHTMDAVAAHLTALGIKFERGAGQLDSAVVPPTILDTIRKLPPGEPFLIPQSGSILVASVTGMTAAPLAVEEARPIAVQLMRKEAVEKTLKQRLKQAKAEAKIEYQPGYGPAKTGKP